MKTFAELMVEAEGFGGKVTPSNNPAITARKVKKKIGDKVEPPLARKPTPKNVVQPKTSMDKHVSDVAAKRDNKARAVGPASRQTGPVKDRGSSVGKAANKAIDIVKKKDKKKKGWDGPESISAKDRYNNNYNTHAYDDVKKTTNSPAKTSDDNVAGAADRLKAKRAKREAGESKSSPQSRPPGIGSGLKSSMGGDIFSKNAKQRSKARTKLGQSAGKAVRSAPGKLFKSINKAQTTQDGPGESGSGSPGIQAAKRGVYN